MGPKVEAAARFAEQTGRAAAIGALDEAALLLDGIHGTTVTLDASARTQPAPAGPRAAHVAAHAES
jgi:hypothetical protein